MGRRRIKGFGIFTLMTSRARKPSPPYTETVMVMILSDTGRHNGNITGVVARRYSEEKLPARYQPKKAKRAYKPTKKNPGNSKITEKDVLAIRKMADTKSNPEIAKQFGISTPAVQAIISRRNWGHVK